MHILVALEKTNDLLQWGLGGPTPPINTPSGITVDPCYPPIPVGDLNGFVNGTATFSVEESANLLVRAFVDEEHIELAQQCFGMERVFSDPLISLYPTCFGDPAIGTTGHVVQKLNVAGLRGAALTGSGVAIAIMDTGINQSHLNANGCTGQNVDTHVQWVPPGMHPPPSAPGSHPVDHGTMCAFDALIAASDAKLLDYPILSRHTVGTFHGVLSDALSANGHLMMWWVGGSGLYNSLVVSNSWGMYHINQDFPSGSPGRYSDNPLHPFHLQLQSMAQIGIDVVFAAGNCGSACPAQPCLNNTTHSIMGASAHPKVLCVGGVDTQDNWVGYSSEGPSIPGMDNEKPDLMAYTHFDGSQALAPDPDSGTSAACPVAAGCIAALRTKVPSSTVSPDHLRTTLENTARNPSGTGWDPIFGNGIIDPIACGQALGVISQNP